MPNYIHLFSVIHNGFPVGGRINRFDDFYLQNSASIDILDKRIAEIGHELFTDGCIDTLRISLLY